MKKVLLAVMLICCVLCFCACGRQETPAPVPTSAPAAPSLNPVLPGSDLVAPGADKEESPSPEEADAPSYDEAMFAAAAACIDKDVSALYEAIGEPADSSYAPSCLGSGEDGELYYEGFTVATYREGDNETVRDVNVNVG